jgi:hypothetical protein
MSARPMASAAFRLTLARMHDLRDVGGTRGGLGTFVVGLAMVVIGGYLLLDQVTVHGGYWRWGGWGGQSSFGITLIPLLFGIGILFFDGQSKVGWVLAGGGALIILAGIITNLDINFRQTSLFNTLIVLGLLVGGLGLVARSVMPSRPRDVDVPDA